MDRLRDHAIGLLLNERPFQHASEMIATIPKDRLDELKSRIGDHNIDHVQEIPNVPTVTVRYSKIWVQKPPNPNLSLQQISKAEMALARFLRSGHEKGILRPNQLIGKPVSSLSDSELLGILRHSLLMGKFPGVTSGVITDVALGDSGPPCVLEEDPNGWIRVRVLDPRLEEEIARFRPLESANV